MPARRDLCNRPPTRMLHDRMAQIAGRDGARARRGVDGARLARAHGGRRSTSSITALPALAAGTRASSVSPLVDAGLALNRCWPRCWRRSISVSSSQACRALPPKPRRAAGRFLRVVTFNLLLRQRPDRRRRQISQPDRRRCRRVAGGDQGSSEPPPSRSRRALSATAVGEFGLVIFSKYPIRADGRVDRPNYPEWISLHGALGRARRERDCRRVGRRASCAALLSRAATSRT